MPCQLQGRAQRERIGGHRRTGWHRRGQPVQCLGRRDDLGDAGVRSSAVPSLTSSVAMPPVSPMPECSRSGSRTAPRWTCATRRPPPTAAFDLVRCDDRIPVEPTLRWRSDMARRTASATRSSPRARAEIDGGIGARKRRRRRRWPPCARCRLRYGRRRPMRDPTAHDRRERARAFRSRGVGRRARSLDRDPGAALRQRAMARSAPTGPGPPGRACRRGRRDEDIDQGLEQVDRLRPSCAGPGCVRGQRSRPRPQHVREGAIGQAARDRGQAWTAAMPVTASTDLDGG